MSGGQLHIEYGAVEAQAAAQMALADTNRSFGQSQLSGYQAIYGGDFQGMAANAGLDGSERVNVSHAGSAGSSDLTGDWARQMVAAREELDSTNASGQESAIADIF